MGDTIAVANAPSSHNLVAAPETQRKTEVEVVCVPTKRKIKPGRCGVCRKKLGLTGFKCQCEIFFCAAHRMPEAHDCEFDFKAAGRDRLATANVAVRAIKMTKI